MENEVNSSIYSTNVRSSSLKIEECVFYYLIHGFLLEKLEEKAEKDYNLLVREIQKMAERLGINIMEKISENQLEKFRKGTGTNASDIKYLEEVKFFCKEFWLYIFGKSIDRLQTNHHGTFYLTEYDFRIISRIKHIDIDEKNDDYKNFCMSFLSSLFKGALSCFSIDADILYETNNDIEYTVKIVVKNY